jgi:hypothetical protein
MKCKSSICGLSLSFGLTVDLLCFLSTIVGEVADRFSVIFGTVDLNAKVKTSFIARIGLQGKDFEVVNKFQFTCNLEELVCWKSEQ